MDSLIGSSARDVFSFEMGSDIVAVVGFGGDHSCSIYEGLGQVMSSTPYVIPFVEMLCFKNQRLQNSNTKTKIGKYHQALK